MVVGGRAGRSTVRLRHRGTEHTVPVGPGETVLDAGLRAGLDLPYNCRVGACGTCRASVSPPTAGDTTVTQNRSGPRSVVLTCQTGSADDLTVDFDAAVDSDSDLRRAAVA